MPTYSYRCDTCNHQFDAVQRFTDDPLTECPECGASIRRVIQPVGVVFKGSGWYITDSRAPQKESGDAEAKPAASKDGAPAGGEAKETPAPTKERDTGKESGASTSTKTEKPAAKAAVD
jgi:putative FmdB family regulatory protein